MIFRAIAGLAIFWIAPLFAVQATAQDLIIENARLALPELPSGFQRFIMLAPPNSSPAMARELQDHPLYQAVTRDAGQKLCDDEFYEDLPVPEVPALILAGTRGFGAPWHPLGHKVNDAVVALDETRLAGIEVEEVPGIHSFLMNRPDVFSRIRDFLSS